MCSSIECDAKQKGIIRLKGPSLTFNGHPRPHRRVQGVAGTGTSNHVPHDQRKMRAGAGVTLLQEEPGASTSGYME